MAPPATIPERAPYRLLLLQNRARRTTGPNAAPKPAHAKLTIWNTLEFGSQARYTERILMRITVVLAATTAAFPLSFT